MVSIRDILRVGESTEEQQGAAERVMNAIKNGEHPSVNDLGVIQAFVNASAAPGPLGDKLRGMGAEEISQALEEQESKRRHGKPGGPPRNRFMFVPMASRRLFAMADITETTDKQDIKNAELAHEILTGKEPNPEEYGAQTVTAIVFRRKMVLSSLTGGPAMYIGAFEESVEDDPASTEAAVRKAIDTIKRGEFPDDETATTLQECGIVFLI